LEGKIHDSERQIVKVSLLDHFHAISLFPIKHDEKILKEDIFVLCVYDENLYSILSDVSLHLSYFLADLNISTVEFSIF